jgi:hypothetical protein
MATPDCGGIGWVRHHCESPTAQPGPTAPQPAHHTAEHQANGRAVDGIGRSWILAITSAVVMGVVTRVLFEMALGIPLYGGVLF